MIKRFYEGEVWGTLSSGKKVPLSMEAVERKVKDRRTPQEAVFEIYGGNLPGRWIACCDGARLPFDKTARQIARQLGWDELIPDYPGTFFNP